MLESKVELVSAPDKAAPAAAIKKWLWVSLWQLVALICAIAWLSALWNLPVDIEDVRPGYLFAFAFEVNLILAALALLPLLRQGRTGRSVAHGLAAATLILVVLTLTDLGVRAVLDRPLTPLLDMHIAPAVVHLLSGSLKGPIGWGAFLGGLFLIFLVYYLSLRAVSTLQALLDQPWIRTAALGIAAVALVTFVGARFPASKEAAIKDRLVNARASATILHQVERSRAMLVALEEFRGEIREDAFASRPSDALLGKLDDVDVIVAFFESYGRSALEQPRYADRLLPTLAGFSDALRASGLSSASGYLTSPTMGGQSWLAHGTLESGLWLAHQSYYDMLLASGRMTLTKAFAKHGHRTVALKPAIIMPWPEGGSFGFQKIYASADLGYAGLPYNWVTMPDQYTLFAFEELERSSIRDVRSPVYAEFSLISSHAPWTHIPPQVVDWHSIGDGALFSQWAELGDPPSVVWRDPDRVRFQYGLSVDYVLKTLASYATTYVDDQTLLIIVGDHQPAPMITGDGVSRDVPMHVITGNPDLLQPFLNWGMVTGMLPAEEAPVRRMDEFRDWFLGAFSE